MEVNHTKIIGVSYCPPLSEQPTTSKPNGFLGYIPQKLPTPPAATISANENSEEDQSDQKHHFKSHVQYQIDNSQMKKSTIHLEQPIAISLQKFEDVSQEPELQHQNSSESHNQNTSTPAPVRLPDKNAKIFVEQGQRINELASEIEELRSRLDQLSSQNELLLQQQLNKNITEHRKP